MEYHFASNLETHLTTLGHFPLNVPLMFSVPFLFAQRVRVKIRAEKRKQNELSALEGKMRRLTVFAVSSVLTLCHDVSNERGRVG